MGIAPDVLINDRYRLVERIAVGSTGQVWRATDVVLARQVAVKILHPERLDDQAFRERFRGEARHAAQLSHPGVAEVHDFGEHRDVAFLVMEYLPGQSLATILERNRELGAYREAGAGLALSVEATLEIVAQVARALQAAHDLGLIHRDIKPANLIVGRDGDVKITDFGTARALDASTVTEPGVVVGTAQYLSPEQASGRPLTPATDVYALGVVAYTCLTGDPPFNGASPVEIAAAHVNDPPPPLPDTIPETVRQLVEDCLAKDPQERPPSAAEVAGRCVASRTALPRATSTRTPVSQRRPAPLGAAAAGAALAVGGMLLFGSGNGSFTSTPIVDDQRIDAGVRQHPRPAPGPAGDGPADSARHAGPAGPAGGLVRPGQPGPPGVATSPTPGTTSPHSPQSRVRDDSGSGQTRSTPPRARPQDSSPSPDSSSTPPRMPSRTHPEETPTSPPQSSGDPARSGTPTPGPSGTGESYLSRTPSGYGVPTRPGTPESTESPGSSLSAEPPATEPPATGNTPAPGESATPEDTGESGFLSPLDRLLHGGSSG